MLQTTLFRIFKKLGMLSAAMIFTISTFAAVQATNAVSLPLPTGPDASNVAPVSVIATAPPVTQQMLAVAKETKVATQAKPENAVSNNTPSTAASTSSTATTTAQTDNNPSTQNIIPIAIPAATFSGPTLPAASMLNNVVPAAPNINAAAYLLMDDKSGYVIAQSNSDGRRAPASLTKLMTMYVLSELIQTGRIKLTDKVTVSENAWRTGGSRMFVQVGSQVPVMDLVNGIVVASGNDACVAMAEFAAGTEQSFVDLMNKTAQQLGMSNTNYADATGLPNPQNYTTAADLATLTRAIINNYPEDYKWYSQKWMYYNNIKQPNRNLLLWRDPSVDGLKTGHTDDAGYCLVASAQRNNTRLIAVVLGSPSTAQRANDVEALLNYGYRFFETHSLFAKNKSLTSLKTWYGKNKETSVGLTNDLYVTLPTGQYKNLTANIVLDKPLEAPIVKGKQYGVLQVTLNKQVLTSAPLIALENNAKAGIFSRTVDHVTLMVKHWFK